jgi:hypothetical protein
MQIIDRLGILTDHRFYELEKLTFKDSFGRLLVTLFKQLQDMEGMKYLPPKFSLSFHDIAQFLVEGPTSEDYNESGTSL